MRGVRHCGMCSVSNKPRIRVGSAGTRGFDRAHEWLGGSTSEGVRRRASASDVAMGRFAIALSSWRHLREQRRAPAGRPTSTIGPRTCASCDPSVAKCRHSSRQPRSPRRAYRPHHLRSDTLHDDARHGSSRLLPSRATTISRDGETQSPWPPTPHLGDRRHEDGVPLVGVSHW